MAITTYTELKAAIADWLLRDDLTSVIPSFIALAEADMNRKLRHWQMETATDISLSARLTALPSDYLSPVSLSVASTAPVRVEMASRADLQARRAKSLDATGVPAYYAIAAGQLEVYPTPDATYTATLTYNAKPEALGDSNASNWVLADHPDIYLMGALAMAAPYLNDDARIGTFAGLYERAINDANEQSSRAQWGASGLRIKIGGR